MKKHVVFLLVAVFTLTACATIQPDRTNIAKEYYYAVELEKQVSFESVQRLGHPYVLDVDVLKEVMGQLVYMGETGIVSQPMLSPVFQADEIERLAPSLIKAAGQAQQDQVVRFVSFGQKKGVFFSNSQKTEGVFFVSEDKSVNFAFNFINTNRATNETSAQYHQYAKLNPLDIQESKTPLVVDTVGFKLQRTAADRQVPMWVDVDLELFKRELKPKDDEPGLPHETLDTVTTSSTSLQVHQATATAVPEGGGQRQDEIKQQLLFLKSLFNDGLISQKEYQQQKAKALKALY